LKHPRQRTKPNYIANGLYLYLIGISCRNAANTLYEIFHSSHISVGKWIQKYRSNKISIKRRKKNNRYIVDEILIKIGSQYTWLWVAIIEPKHKQILQQIDISFERTMLIVAE